MRKFTYVDIRDWKVTDVNGKPLCLIELDEKGKIHSFEKFDGFRSASSAAKRLNGTARRA